jgi:hypothetical protein
MKKQKGFIETTAIIMLLAFFGIIWSHSAAVGKDAPKAEGQEQTAQK